MSVLSTIFKQDTADWSTSCTTYQKNKIKSLESIWEKIQQVQEKKLWVSRT